MIFYEMHAIAGAVIVPLFAYLKSYVPANGTKVTRETCVNIDIKGMLT